MSLVALILVLASAFFHALWNVLLKGARDVDSTSSGVFAVALVTTAVAVPWLPGRVFPQTAALLWGLAAGFWEGCYFVALTRSIETVPLGWAYTWMRGSAILFAWPLSVCVMGDDLGWLTALSVLAVCAGLVLMGLTAAPSAGARSVLWALMAGAFIAAFNLCYKLSLHHGAHPVALFAVSMSVGLPVQLAVRASRRGFAAVFRVPEEPARVLVAGLVCTGSFLLFLFGLRSSGAATVLTFRNVSVVFALVLAALFGERATRRQWLGAVLTTVGAMGLGWPR